MKLSIICLLLLFQSIFALSQWDNFKATYQKSYKNVKQENYRKQIFLKNLELIEEHNKKYEEGLVTFKIGINHLADVSKERKPPSKKTKYTPPTSTKVKTSLAVDVPDSIDWRDYGVVTPVSDQSWCNTCWAFAVVGTIEAHMGIYHGENVSLSRQNLADCVDPTFDCSQHLDPKMLDRTYQYMTANGIDSYDSYPVSYVEQEPCAYDPANVAATISGYGNVTEADEEDLKRVVGTIGPVSSTITTQFDFDLYQSGIYYNEKCLDVEEIFNHVVVVVGYGTENGQDYWIVKNSWGTWFGLEGYIKMARNKGNLCGIASRAKYPIM